jgi:hypothetical protein
MTRFVLLVFALSAAVAGGDLRIPASTAYTLPDAEGARVSRSGVTRWTNPAISVVWYGQFTNTGSLTASLALRLPKDAESKLELTVANQSHSATVTGAGSATPILADFGTFELSATGYHRLTLNSLNPSGRNAGDLDAILLGGPATTNAHFNLRERRNAASVHLNYPVPNGTNIAAFYSEVTALEDPTSTFYMACGWHRGYFGMQVNSPTERRIIFSVWDSGSEAQNRSNVADENRVTLVGKGDGVVSGDFGNEGTGGHSHLVYPWKTRETQRFIVTAQPTNQTFTVYSGYWFHPEQNTWMLISSWRAPKEGGWLRRPHGFSENFWGSNGHIVRKALFGNQWIRTPEGEWLELTTATFSHDPTGRSDRFDRFMGVENGCFFLQHGGFVPGFTPFGEKLTRPPSGKAPSNLDLPTPSLKP